MRWLHIGTSPTVNDTLPLARGLFNFDKIITCNRGILLEPKPDFYLATDMKVGRQYETEARAAQAAGTRLVTYLRDQQAMIDRRVDFYDEFITEGVGDPTRAAWGMFRLTGPMCVEYACRTGCTELVMVGCDGYRGQPHADYFDDYWRDERPGAEHRTQIMHLAFRKIAEVFHDVRFIRYGRPLRNVPDCPNWEERPCAAL